MFIANKNIAFVVNSNKKFCDRSLDKIIPSLIKAGIKKSSIIVIIGGFDDLDEASDIEWLLRTKFDIKKLYAVKQDSCDYTTFNFMIDRPEVFDNFNYIFYLHDTSWVEDDFLTKLEKYTPKEDVDSYGLTGAWSMNIGLYKVEFLLGQREKIRQSFNTINTLDSINQWKKWGALNEDYLMNKSCGNYLSHDDVEIITMENPYGTDTVRRTRYFKCLDLYKSQSNWDGVQNEMSKSL